MLSAALQHTHRHTINSKHTSVLRMHRALGIRMKAAQCDIFPSKPRNLTRYWGVRERARFVRSENFTTGVNLISALLLIKMISVVNNIVLRRVLTESIDPVKKEAIGPFPSAKYSVLPGDISFKGVFGLHCGNCLLPSITERPMIEAVVCTLIYMAAISSQQENTITQGLMMNNATLVSHPAIIAWYAHGHSSAHTRTHRFLTSAKKVFPPFVRLTGKSIKCQSLKLLVSRAVLQVILVFDVVVLHLKMFAVLEIKRFWFVFF